MEQRIPYNLIDKNLENRLYNVTMKEIVDVWRDEFDICKNC